MINLTRKEKYLIFHFLILHFPPSLCNIITMIINIRFALNALCYILQWEMNISVVIKPLIFYRDPVNRPPGFHIKGNISPMPQYLAIYLIRNMFWTSKNAILLVEWGKRQTKIESVVLLSTAKLIFWVWLQGTDNRFWIRV